jgi:hypothetical protein
MSHPPSAAALVQAPALMPAAAPAAAASSSSVHARAERQLRAVRDASATASLPTARHAKLPRRAQCHAACCSRLRVCARSAALAHVVSLAPLHLLRAVRATPPLPFRLRGLPLRPQLAIKGTCAPRALPHRDTCAHTTRSVQARGTTAQRFVGTPGSDRLGQAIFAHSAALLRILWYCMQAELEPWTRTTSGCSRSASRSLGRAGARGRGRCAERRAAPGPAAAELRRCRNGGLRCVCARCRPSFGSWTRPQREQRGPHRQGQRRCQQCSGAAAWRRCCSIFVRPSRRGSHPAVCVAGGVARRRAGVPTQSGAGLLRGATAAAGKRAQLASTGEPSAPEPHLQSGAGAAAADGCPHGGQPADTTAPQRSSTLLPHAEQPGPGRSRPA